MRLQNRGIRHARFWRVSCICIVVATLAAGCSPSIHDFAARGDVASVERMLESDPALIRATNELGKTPLHFAASHNRLDSMQALLPHEPDLNARDATGMTALHICAGRNFRPLLRFLVQNGADVSAKDDFGDTPLHAAAMHGATECVNDLLKVKADPWATNKEGLTPKELAERFGHDSIANRLGLIAPLVTDSETL